MLNELEILRNSAKLSPFIYWGTSLFFILIKIIIGLIFLLVLKSALRIFFRNLGSKSRLASYKKRIDTLRTLTENIISFAVLIIIVFMIIGGFGFDVAPLLASAGLLGLAFSFGAQTLIRDLIAGFLIISENQFNVGDMVEVADTKGEVIRINLRTIVIRDKKGNKTYLPNSKIEKVTVFKVVPSQSDK